MPPLHDLARLLGMGRLTHVVDIGANPIDGAPPPHKPLLDARLCRVTGRCVAVLEQRKILAAGALQQYIEILRRSG